MLLPHRRPSVEARRAMSRAALELDVRSNAELIRRAEEAVARLTGHRFARVVASGSCAALAALSATHGRVMLPDQGAWRGYESYARLLGREVCRVRTRLGILQPETLEEALERERPGVLVVTSFAGYIAEQDLRQVHELCREHGVLLIEDASSAVGDVRLARAENADIIVCSTGDPKVVNLASGGFIATSDGELLGRAKAVLRACRSSGVVAAGMVEELRLAPRVVERLVEFASLLKTRLPGVLHRDRRGVCVGVLHPSPNSVARRARELGLGTDLGRSLLTLCPNEDRFLERGVCVELKKLDVLRMHREQVLQLAEVLEELLS
ncbi:MAG: aminotransferase class I/II-fold pyridoxal phosphate-dependent enzyme [Euryarchaeota archaeon]|nr:aminotransferase class I/II-fold pyridoxal phosphate-dependent enzyme [Euryarchaeota archaeon]